MVMSDVSHRKRVMSKPRTFTNRRKTPNRRRTEGSWGWTMVAGEGTSTADRLRLMQLVTKRRRERGGDQSGLIKSPSRLGNEKRWRGCWESCVVT